MIPEIQPAGINLQEPESASSSAIPTPVQNYLPGANGHHQEEKAKKPTYYRMCVDSYADIDPRLDDSARRLLGLMLTLKRPDGIIIAGKDKLAFFIGRSPRRVYAYLKKLCAAGYLCLVKRGGGCPGNADAYAPGEMYAQERAEWCAKKFEEKRQEWEKVERERWSEMTGLKIERWSKTDIKAGYRLPSHPTYTNITTHIHEASLPLEERVWVKHCKETFPDWDQTDIEGSFFSAKAKGGMRDWRAFAAKCYKNRRKPAQSRPIGVQTSPTAQAPLDDTSGSYQIDRLLNMVTGSCTDHKKPSFHQFKREAERLLIPGHKIQGIFKSLESRRWITKDGEPVKNWKSYLNAVARSQRYSDNA